MIRRILFWALASVVLTIGVIQPVWALFVTQQDQISVTILINVTPAPVVLRAPQTSAPSPYGIVASLSLDRRAPAGLRQAFRAESVRFSPELVAQAMPTAHGSVNVQAEVSPNPNATLLYSDQPFVSINATAGTTVTLTCAYHVTVDSTKSWQLDDGLSANFSSTFLGGDLSRATYLAPPAPAPTPFLVYATDGNKWALIETGNVMRTYCVDLKVAVPLNVPGGAYSSNAIYTLYY